MQAPPPSMVSVGPTPSGQLLLTLNPNSPCSLGLLVISIPKVQREIKSNLLSDLAGRCSEASPAQYQLTGA